MANELIMVDRRIDQLLTQSVADSIALLSQEYQITSDKHLFVLALIAKLVATRAMVNT